MANIPKIIAVEPLPVTVSGTHDFAISEGRTRVHTSVILQIRTEDDNLQGIAEDLRAGPGFLCIPDGPGLGVRLDPDRISGLQTNPTT